MLQVLVELAAAASLAAGVIHGWLVPEHFAEQPVAGLGFLLMAFVQAGYAAALLDRPGSGRLLAAGLAGNLVLILLLVVAHTLGLPLVSPDGPGQAHGVGFGAAEIATLATELALVLALAALLRGRPRPSWSSRAWPPSGRA